MSPNADIVTVHVPLTLRRRGSRKLVLAPDGTPLAPSPSARIDNALVKAIARAFRWRRLIETGVYATIKEIAAAEKIDPSYVSRILRLTLLAPDIVEAILEGRQPDTITLAMLMKPFPVEWKKQQRVWSAKPRSMKPRSRPRSKSA